jgi:DNA polymerase-3 subunit alpha
MTVCLNNYSDDAERTAKLKKELEYFGIKLSNIKFGMSRAKYSYDKQKHLIIKGIGSIKFLNNTVSEELYTLSQSRVYNNFIDLLVDITEMTSCNSRQLDILIKLDYFSEFGEAKELLWKTFLFDKLYVKGKGFKSNIKQSKLGLDYQFIEQYCTEFKPAEVKEVNVDAIQTVLGEHESKLEEFNNMLAQCIRHKKDGTENGINYEKLFKLTEMPEDIKQRFATKTSEAEFKGLDGYKLLTNIQYNGNIMSVKEKIKYQQEYLSYIDYTDPNINQNYIVVTNLNTNYSPKFTAYRLKDGKTVNLKVRKNKKGRDYNVKNSFKDTPFEDGDILQMLRCKAEPKAKFIDGEWKRDYTDKEWWLYEYNVIGEN